MSDPILILTGPPGVGKTTVARLLAGRHERAVHLEADRFFAFIASGRIDPWRPESHGQNEVVMEIVAHAATGYADAGYLTIIDGIVSPSWFLEPLRGSLESSGHRVAYAVLRAPLAVCLERAAARGDAGLSDALVLEQLFSDFADHGPPEDHAIDTRDTDAETTVERLARGLRDGSFAI